MRMPFAFIRGWKKDRAPEPQLPPVLVGIEPRHTVGLVRRKAHVRARRTVKKEDARVLFVSGVLVLLSLLALFVVGLGTSFRQSISQPDPDSAQKQEPDPFFQSRVGNVLLDRVETDGCWMFDFDNRSGGYRNYRRVPCAAGIAIKPPVLEPTPPAGKNRFQAVRDAFVNR